MTMKHDAESFKIYLNARDLSERAHTVAVLESYGQDSTYDKSRLVKQYQELREALYKAGWL